MPYMAKGAIIMESCGLESRTPTSSAYLFNATTESIVVPSETAQCKYVGQLLRKSAETTSASVTNTPSIAISSGSSKTESYLFVSNSDAREVEVWRIDVSAETRWSCRFIASVSVPQLSSLSRLACEFIGEGDNGRLVLWVTCPEASCVVYVNLFPSRDGDFVGVPEKLESGFKPVAIAVAEAAQQSTKIAVVDGSSGFIYIFRRNGDQIKQIYKVDGEETKCLSSSSSACFDSDGTLWVSNFKPDALLKCTTDGDTKVITKVYKTCNRLQGLCRSQYDQHQVAGCIAQENRVVAVKTKNGEARCEDILPRRAGGVEAPLFMVCSSKVNLCAVSGRSANNAPAVFLFEVNL